MLEAFAIIFVFSLLTPAIAVRKMLPLAEECDRMWDDLDCPPE